MKNKIGDVFEINVQDKVFYGCIIGYWGLTNTKKASFIAFVFIETPNSLDTIMKMTCARPIYYLFFCARKWIGTKWKIINHIEVPELPDFLTKAHMGRQVYQMDKYGDEAGKLNLSINDNSDNYQAFLGANAGNIEYLLEHAIKDQSEGKNSIKFVPLKDESFELYRYSDGLPPV